MSTQSQTKLILVIGATGAQGIAVINKLLEPTTDGKSSPYSIRALTRDPGSRRAVGLKQKGVECVKGYLTNSFFLLTCILMRRVIVVLHNKQVHSTILTV